MISETSDHTSITPASRRSFLQKITALGSLSLLPTAGLMAQNEDEPLEVQAGPYLQNVLHDEATIMWITNRNCFSWVEYGDGNHLHRKFFDVHNGLIQANNRVNKIKLKGIKSGRSHKYRIVSTEIVRVSGSQFHFGTTYTSPVYSFQTPAADESSFRMVVFNDHHERPQTIPELLYRFGYKGNEKDFDLVVFNGDVFDNTESEEQVVQQFLRPCVDIFAKETPFLFVQGNHEVRGAFSRQIPDYFSFVDERFYHAFNRGPVRIIVLDGGEDKSDDNWEYRGLVAFDPYREVQREWLRREIQSEAFKQATFKVVLIHIPLWHSGDWHGPTHCREMFGDLLEQGGIDLMLSGHTHRYGIHPPDADHSYPVMIGGGPVAGNRTLIKVVCTRENVQATMVKDDGEVIGELNLKPKKKR
ncbi:metallophosphoesterase [Lunatimonas sp.]|uniref:metallophosphoesterase family protein n=1 Tax=Lunatimonas sp. TaxID=2060141 RepID=UPI00263B0B2A|nr:metallophosphoesterase [Lunatimonas sp.]